MGLGTVLGGQARGVFIPMRHGASVERDPPAVYPEIEAVLARAEPSIDGVLEALDGLHETLLAFDGREPPPAPRRGQLWFPGLDGAAAYALVRRYRPARVVEVGSGHSTRFTPWRTAALTAITSVSTRSRARRWERCP